MKTKQPTKEELLAALAKAQKKMNYIEAQLPNLAKDIYKLRDKVRNLNNELEAQLLKKN